MTDQPEAGWYDDPDVDGGLRWWDGDQWSDHREGPGADPSDEDADDDESADVVAAEPPETTSRPPPPVAIQRRPDVPVPPPQPAGSWAPPGSGWAPQPVAWQPVVPQRVDGRAAASLILALLWLFGIGSLAAIPLGIMGRRALRDEASAVGGRGMATAGIVLGVLGLVAGVGIAIALSG